MNTRSAASPAGCILATSAYPSTPTMWTTSMRCSIVQPVTRYSPDPPKFPWERTLPDRHPGRSQRGALRDTPAGLSKR